MSLSRRQFISRTSLSAVSAPALLGLGMNYCNAAADSAIDWSMGFPSDAVLLNRNENPVGPSPLAVEAAKLGIQKAFRYADGDNICSLLAEHHGVAKEYVLVGTGSGELLELAPLVFCRGGNLVTTVESYRQTPSFAEKLGIEVKWVNLLKDKNYAYDIPGLIAAVDADTRLLFTVTPNNPTGTTLSYDELRTIADALPKHVLFVIDEAYVHFQPEAKSGVDLVKEGYSNVLVTRTFSKAYALAGLRCGYGLGHPDIMRKIGNFGCGPTSTNMAGFGAAIASLNDPAHIERSRKFVSETRAYYELSFRELGIPYVSGPPSFILAEFGEKTTAIRDELRNRHIFVRDASEWNLPHHMRISYGFEAENQAFFKALKNLI